MRVGDPEYKRKLDMISMIPSNKIDSPNLNGYSEQDMDRFEEHSERVLREQVRAYSDRDLKIVADEITQIGWTYTYNALGDYFEKLHKQKEAIKTINQE